MKTQLDKVSEYKKICTRGGIGNERTHAPHVSPPSELPEGRQVNRMFVLRETVLHSATPRALRCLRHRVLRNRIPHAV